MDQDERNHLRRLRRWAVKFGLKIETLRTRSRVLEGLFLRDLANDKVVPTGGQGFTLAALEKEINKRGRRRD